MINDYEAMGETTVKTYNRGTSCQVAIGNFSIISLNCGLP